MVLTAMVSAFSCTEKEKEKATEVNISGISDAIRFEAMDPQSVSFQIQSNKSWIITTKDADWFSISPTEGEADKLQTVTVTATDNPQIDAREASLTISAAEFTKTVTVSQLGAAPALFIDGAKDNAIHFETAGGTVALTATGNIAWTTEKTNLDWCTVAPVEGPAATVTTVNVTAESNKGDAREGTLTFKYGSSTIAIKVSQDELKRYLTPDKAEVVIPDWGGEEKIVVSANVEWTATSSDSWLAVSPAAGTGDNVDVMFSAEEFSGERSATVTFKGEGVQDVVIAVTQKAVKLDDDPTLPKTLATWNLPEDAADEDRFKAHNPDWPVTEKGQYRQKGIIIAEDNINTGEWVIAHVADQGDYFRTNWSAGLLAAGIWLDDGFKFSVKNLTADAGRTISFYCGMRTANAQVLGYWGCKISYDGGKTWREADYIKWTKAKDLSEVDYFTSANSDVVAHFKIRKAVKDQDVYVFFYAKTAPDGRTLTSQNRVADFEKTKTESYSLRFRPPYQKHNGLQYVGPTITLEN